MNRAGWFRVKSSGAFVRATESDGKVRLHDGTNNDYDSEAFEFVGERYAVPSA